MNRLPALSEADLDALRHSIERDGVVIPVAVDRNGEIIDGHNRKAIALALGVPCPTVSLDVDDETADRLRLSLNLARRQMSELDRHELLAEIAKPMIEKVAAKAQERMKAGKADPGDSVSPGSRAPRTADVVAKDIATETAALGAPIKVSGRTVERAIKVAALPAPAKDRIRLGATTVAAEMRKARKPEPIRIVVPDDFDPEETIFLDNCRADLNRASIALGSATRQMEAIAKNRQAARLTAKEMRSAADYFGRLVVALAAIGDAPIVRDPAPHLTVVGGSHA